VTSRLVLQADAVVAAADAQLRELRGRHPDADWVLIGASLPTRVEAARRLAGFARADDLAEAQVLHAAGVAVELRWSIAAENESQLSEVTPEPTWRVVVVPDLERPPRLDRVAAAWPTAVSWERSSLWPACLAVEAAVAPEPERVVRSAAARHLPACLACGVRDRCPGLAAGLAGALDAAGVPFDGWHARPGRAAAPTETGSATAFAASSDLTSSGRSLDPQCAELRGLALGLRQAWRMTLPAGELANFRQFIAAQGLAVAVGPALQLGPAGAMRLANEGEVLLVVAARPELAAACLQAEVDNIARASPTTPAAIAAHLSQTLAVHRQLGAAYGYPSCCVEAFCDAHTEVLHTARDGDNPIAILRAHLRSRRHLALLDTLGDGVQRSPLRHLPCRFDCPASLALAERLRDDARQQGSSLARPPEPTPVAVLADGRMLRAEAGESVAALTARARAMLAASGRWPVLLPFSADGGES
jgi:hypothetical protein